MIADDFNIKENNSVTITGGISTNLINGGFSHPDIGFIHFNELQQMLKAKQDLKNMIDIQGQIGNWTCSEYMLGLLNGLVLAGISFGLTTEDDMKERGAEGWIQD